MARLFFRLKLRLLRNGFRGNRFRVVSFIAGILFALEGAAFGFVVLAAPPGGTQARTAVAVLVFVILFVGWALLPLFGFGVDETLDPERLGLLPLRRRDLMTGLFVASSTGLAPVATFIALCGAFVGFARSAGAAVVVAVAVVAEFGLAVAVARALTTAMSRVLRSRKARDLAAVALSLLGLAFAALGQAPRLLSGSRPLSPRVSGSILSTLGWTPPGLAARAMSDAARGRFGIAALELVPALLLGLLLMWWWAVNLDRLLTTAEAPIAPRRRRASNRAAVLPGTARPLPRTRAGAVAAKDLLYQWREPFLRVQLVTVPVVLTGAVVAAAVTPALNRPESVLYAAGLVWWVTLGTLNSFAIDRSAYWMNVVATGDPAADLRGKNLAGAVVALPVLTVVAVALAAVTGGWSYLPSAIAAAAGLLGVQFAVGNVASVRLAQPYPESRANLWAARQGQGCGTALLMLLVIALDLVLVSPILGLVAAGVALWRPMIWLAAPIGLAYGALLYWIGLRIASGWLRGQQAELVTALSRRAAV